MPSMQQHSTHPAPHHRPRRSRHSSSTHHMSQSPLHTHVSHSCHRSLPDFSRLTPSWPASPSPTSSRRHFSGTSYVPRPVPYALHPSFPLSSIAQRMMTEPEIALLPRDEEARETPCSYVWEYQERDGRWCSFSAESVADIERVYCNESHNNKVKLRGRDSGWTAEFFLSQLVVRESESDEVLPMRRRLNCSHGDELRRHYRLDFWEDVHGQTRGKKATEKESGEETEEEVDNMLFEVLPGSEEHDAVMARFLASPVSIPNPDTANQPFSESSASSSASALSVSPSPPRSPSPSFPLPFSPSRPLAPSSETSHPPLTVTAIHRIQNTRHMNQFLTRMVNTRTPNQQWWFHGTPQSCVRSIIAHGIDGRRAKGKRASLYGVLNYFARDAQQAAGYCREVQQQLASSFASFASTMSLSQRARTSTKLQTGARSSQGKAVLRPPYSAQYNTPMMGRPITNIAPPPSSSPFPSSSSSSSSWYSIHDTGARPTETEKKTESKRDSKKESSDVTTHYMFLARVLVGNTWDSVIDDKQRMTVVGVREPDQSYPQYLIAFTESKEKGQDREGGGGAGGGGGSKEPD